MALEESPWLVEAQGGKDKLLAVESAKFNGNMMMGPGMEVPFTMVFRRPMNMRLEFTMQGMTAVQAYDGETAWSIMPFMGKTDPEVMADDQAKNIKEQADFDGPLAVLVHNRIPEGRLVRVAIDGREYPPVDMSGGARSGMRTCLAVDLAPGLHKLQLRPLLAWRSGTMSVLALEVSALAK